VVCTAFLGCIAGVIFALSSLQRFPRVVVRIMICDAAEGYLRPRNGTWRRTATVTRPSATECT